MRNVTDETVQGCVNEPASGGRFEKLGKLAAMDIGTKLQSVVVHGVRYVILILVSGPGGVLWEVDPQPDSRPARSRIESGEAQLGDFDRRD